MPQREVEAKIVLGSCNALEAIESRLRGLGAVVREDVVEEDLYFQHPCRDFAETDEALRLRKRRDRVELTYKGPKEGGVVKARREVNVEVNDFNAARELLESLGFKPVLVVRKERRYYELGKPHVIVTLDRVDGLGCFVEVEAVEGGEEAVLEAIRALGLEGYPRTVKSYLELLLERRGERVH